mgnify:CR=1 FL=1
MSIKQHFARWKETEAAKLRPMTAKQRAGYILHYYRFWFIGLALLLLVGFYIGDAVIQSHEEILLQGFFTNDEYNLFPAERIEKDYAATQTLTRQQRVVFDDALYIDLGGEASEYTAASNGKLTRPLVFYLILGLFQTLVERMWYLMSIQASGPSITDPKLQEVLGDMAQSMSLPLTILLTPGILAIQLCFFASVFYLMLRLVQPENVQFRTVFRVIAYSAAPTVVCIVPLVGPLVGSIWFGVCCFIGCKYSMRLPWSRTGLALGPLYLIAFAIGMQLIRQFLSMSA